MPLPVSLLLLSLFAGCAGPPAGGRETSAREPARTSNNRDTAADPPAPAPSEEPPSEEPSLSPDATMEEIGFETGIPARLWPEERDRWTPINGDGTTCTVRREAGGGPPQWERYVTDEAGYLTRRERWRGSENAPEERLVERYSRSRRGQAQRIIVETGGRRTEHAVRFSRDGDARELSLTPDNEEGFVRDATVAFDAEGRVVSYRARESGAVSCAYRGDSFQPAGREGNEAWTDYVYDEAGHLIGWNTRIEADWNLVTVARVEDDGALLLETHSVDGVVERARYEGPCFARVFWPCSVHLILRTRQ